jgi:outer membrane receptor protein involved in Fe transport
MKIRSTYYLAVLMGILSTSILDAQSSSTSEDEVYDLSPFTVESRNDRGFGTTDSMGASRIAQSNLDVASSIITISDQLLDDLGAREATEALGFVSGVQLTSDRLPGHTQYSLRGYALGGVSLRDGLPDPGDAKDIPLDESSSYERLEIIKGPAGTLYGSHSMGGIVNKVSKWPRFQKSATLDISATGGFEEYFQGVLDATGPFEEGGDTAYRVTLSHTNGDRHYDEGNAPMEFTNATFMVDHKLENGLGHVWGRLRYFDYKLDREQGWQYITGYLTPGASSAPTVKNPIFAVGRSANIVPEDDISIGDIHNFELGWEQSWETDSAFWTLRLVGRNSKGTGDKSPSYSQGRPVPVHATGQRVTYINAAGVETNGDNRFVSARNGLVADWRAALTLRDFRGFAEDTGLFADLVGKFDTGGANHTLILNANFQDTEDERAFFFWGASNPNDPTEIGNTFSAVNPNFSGVNVQSIQANNEKRFNRFQGNAQGEFQSIGFQDNISFNDDKIIITAGARYDDTSVTNHRFDVAESITADRFIRDPDATTVTNGNNVSYKVGGVYKASETVSLFGQLSQTYNPISSVDENENANPDQEGEMLEVGVKFQTEDNRWVGTFSIFDMELSNVLIAVPTEVGGTGGGTVLRPVGTQKSDGFEFDVAGEPIDGWTMLLAYSDVTSTSASGAFFRGVPTDPNYSAVTKYQFQQGDLAGSFLGLAYRHNGRAPGDSGNSWFVDNNDMLDLFFGYEMEKWSVQLNVYNVTGEDDILSAVIDRLASRMPDTFWRLTGRFRF